jgi:nucleolar protein 9
MDPFASHVIRAILTLLLPHAFPPESSKFAVRSKKSASWKAHQGPMKSMFAADAEPKTLEAGPISKFTKMARKFVEKAREELSGNEIRALAANQVASPVLQVR